MKNIPYWLDIPYTEEPTLETDIETDVVVIGGGITGVSAAYHCTKAGFNTVLIEKDIVGFGSAGRNGGMVVEGLEIDFVEMVDTLGIEPWQRTIEAKNLVISLVTENSIECDLEHPGSLYLGFTSREDQDLQQEAMVRKNNGIPCEIIEKGRQLNKSPFGAGLFVGSDTSLHPVKFIRGLVTVAKKHGLKVYEHTPATTFDAHTVHTPKGTITAKKVVVALESANPTIVGEVKISRSQAIVTEPLSDAKISEMDWKIGGMLWTTSDDYICCRKVGNRLFACKNLPINPTEEELEQNKNWQITKIQSFFPMLTKDDLQISHQWSGLMVGTQNHLPCIRNTNGYFEIFGHSGNGLTNGILTGKLLADHFMGAEIPAIYAV